MHFNFEVIDYVIIHELVHLWEPNHSQAFWKLVVQFCPNFKVCQQILKQVFL
ncbi:YgjP-like metallopeptidase domain-containing protein [Spiroplasma endosymbiont of Nephrotoma flavescens]